MKLDVVKRWESKKMTFAVTEKGKPMDDLIRRLDAIEVINKLMEIHFDRKVVLGKVWQQIKDLPSAQQWIPCSEMLPMDKGVYLVTDDSGRVAWVEKSWFMWCDDGSPFWEYANVTAWMPLPEPYREEEVSD